MLFVSRGAVEERLSGGGTQRHRIDGDVAATQLLREDAGKCDDGRLLPDRGPRSSRSFRAFLFR